MGLEGGGGEDVEENPTFACREHIESIAQRHLELFPPGFEQGFIFKGTYHSKKQDIDLGRIKLEATGDTFQLRPSFLMPYMIGRTEELNRALYLRLWGVPCDALAHVFGKDSSFWYRASLSLGRPSIVGATVKSKDKLPPHIVSGTSTPAAPTGAARAPATSARSSD